MLGPFGIDISWPAELGLAPLAITRYSPLALRDLRQPVPSGVPSHVDASIFTFEDAFEDLLAVSRGQDLPDISIKFEQRKLLRYMYPDGEPAQVWLRRLQSQSLLDVPRADQLANMVDANWDKFHHELDRRAAAVWRAAMGHEEGETRGQVSNGRHHGDLDDGGYNGHNPLLEDLEQRPPRSRQPEHFEDLFSSIESSFSNAQSTWDSFVKSITDNPSTVHERSLPNTQAEKEKQVVVKDEYVDRFGYLHSKVTTKTLDENGEQIGSQTHYTVRPASENDYQAKEQSGQDAEESSGIGGKGRVEAKTSWVWK